MPRAARARGTPPLTGPPPHHCPDVAPPELCVAMAQHNSFWGDSRTNQALSFPALCQAREMEESAASRESREESIGPHARQPQKHLLSC